MAEVKESQSAIGSRGEEEEDADSHGKGLTQVNSGKDDEEVVGTGQEPPQAPSDGQTAKEDSLSQQLEAVFQLEDKLGKEQLWQWLEARDAGDTDKMNAARASLADGGGARQAAPGATTGRRYPLDRVDESDGGSRTTGSSLTVEGSTHLRMPETGDRVRMRPADVEHLRLKEGVGEREANIGRFADAMAHGSKTLLQCIPREVRSQVALDLTERDHTEQATREQQREMAEVGGISAADYKVYEACVAGLLMAPAEERRVVLRKSLRQAASQSHKTTEEWRVAMGQALPKTMRAGPFTKDQVAEMVAMVAASTNVKVDSLSGMVFHGLPWATVAKEGGVRVPVGLTEGTAQLRSAMATFIDDLSPYFRPSGQAGTATGPTQARAWAATTDDLCWDWHYKGACPRGTNCRKVKTHVGKPSVKTCPYTPCHYAQSGRPEMCKYSHEKKVRKRGTHGVPEVKPKDTAHV